MSDPIFLNIGPLAIRWYGVAAALGALAAFWYVRAFAVHKDLIKKHLVHLFTPLVIWGIIGARLYHVAGELPYYLNHPQRIPALWSGGLAIHGAVLAAGLYLFFYAKKHRISFFALADALAPGMMLGQAIGRWGNFFNQELFGKPTELPWGIFIDPMHRPPALSQFDRFHPAFLYESLWNLIAVTALTIWLTKKPPRNDGIIFANALILWGLGRLFVELIRVDEVPQILGVRLPFITSALVVALAATLLYKKTT